MCDKTPWTQFEDEAIENIINEFPEDIDWKYVESALILNYGIKNRTAKQCKERWINNLDPSCKKKGWSAEEDNIIFNFQKKIGNNWSQITKFLVGRSENTIKNHFYATIRRKFRIFNKFHDEKITAPLKDILKNQELMDVLINQPEKNTKPSNFQIRKSLRIEKMQKDITKSDVDINDSDKFDLKCSGETCPTLDESPSKLLQTSSLTSFSVPDHFPNPLKTHATPQQKTYFPSFTLMTSFEFHHSEPITNPNIF